MARYLKGETISLLPRKAPQKGWCLVSAEVSHSLGQGNNMTLKNNTIPAGVYSNCEAASWVDKKTGELWQRRKTEYRTDV